MTVPYCGYFDGSTVVGRLGVLTSLSVNNTIVVSSVSDKIRAAWSSGTTADTLSGFARLSHDGLSTLAAVDGHIRATGVVATGTGVGPCFVVRWSNPGDASCYILKETTPGDPSSWQLYWYSDASPETLAAVGAAITPSGSPTDYTDLNVEYGFVGNSHWIKIWEGTEPSTYTLRTASSEKLTGGEIGAGAWGANGTGDMVEYDTLSYATWNQALVTGRNQQIGDTSLSVTYGGSGDAVPFQFDAPQDVPLYVVVLNSHGSSPSQAESLVATNLVIDGILADEEVNAADAWLTIYKAHATAPITGGYLQATFPAAGGNQTGCCLQVVVVGGAADYVNPGAHADDGATATSLTVAPTTFTNAYDTSGTIASEYHGNTNASTIDTTPTHIPGPVSTHATPGVRLTTTWVDANDTSVAFSWTGAVRHCAIAAEIQLADPADHYVETPTEVTGVAAVSSGFTMTVAATREVVGTAAISSGFTATVAGLREVSATVAVTSGFTLTAAGTVDTPGGTEVFGTAAISSGFTLTTAGVREVLAAATVSSGFTATVAGVREVLATAAVSSGFAVTVAGLREILATAAVSSGFTVTASGVRAVDGAAAISSGFTLTATGIREVLATAVIGSGFTVEVAAVRTVVGTVTISSGFTLVVFTAEGPVLSVGIPVTFRTDTRTTIHSSSRSTYRTDSFVTVRGP